MRKVDYAGKCGTCTHFEANGVRRSGWCHEAPYDDSIVHDPKHPYRARNKSDSCRFYFDMRDTNGDRIRAMSDEELANFFLFFCPTVIDKPKYTGLTGKYTNSAEETIRENSNWLKIPAKD